MRIWERKILRLETEWMMMVLTRWGKLEREGFVGREEIKFKHSGFKCLKELRSSG